MKTKFHYFSQIGKLKLKVQLVWNMPGSIFWGVQRVNIVSHTNFVCSDKGRLQKMLLTFEHLP